MVDAGVRVAVVGHVEWVEFLRVERVPTPGEIVGATSLFHAAAGGGAVAAVQLARWTGTCLFFTAFGDDELGEKTAADLRARGVEVHATIRPEPQRRAITLVDAQRERTILVVGPRLTPYAADPLPWDELASCDAVFVTAGDVAAIRATRRARTVVATSRIVPRLREAGIQLDALVGSANDADERYTRGDLVTEPRLVVRTDGARGGRWETATEHGSYAAVPTEVRGDTYGAGDTFAAGLALALAEGKGPAAATADAAARAASVLGFTGPYAPQPGSG